MAGKARFSSKAKESVLGGLIGEHITDGANLMNALEFIESPAGCGIKLYPVQRIITKLIFGIPMDWEEREVPVYDIFCDKLLYTFKETEYIHYAGSEGRLNISDWRDANPEGYNEIDMVVGRRGGKALDLDELIPTTRGMVRMGDLTEQDTVFSPSGSPIKIKYAHPPFVSKTYLVTFDDGSQVIAHGGHLWKTLTKADRKAKSRNLSPTDAKRPQSCRGAFEGTVKTTEEIKNTLLYQRPDGKVETNHSIPLAQAVELPYRELPVDPYFLGIWLGDGSSNTISITTQDDQIKEAVYTTASTYGLQVRVSSNGSKAKTYHISSGCRGKADRNPLLAKFQQLNLIKNKHIPQEYLWASKEQRLALLQGLMDTDGNCCRSRSEFNNTNEQLARGVFHLAASLGLKPYWREKRATLGGEDCGPCYRVTWTGTLPVFRLDYKLANLPTQVKSCQTQRFIVSVEDFDERPVRCITVDTDEGLFLFGETFNTTHNSLLVAGVAAYKLYRLLSVRSPQEYFGLVPGSPIDITLMAQDSEGSARLYDALKACIQLAPFFGPYVKHMGGDEMTFISEADRNNRDITPSIKAAARPCTTNAVRGPSSYFLALDEFAFYRNQIGSNSDEMYEAATPATMQFKAGGIREGKRESMIFIITSPGSKIGKYYTLFKTAMEDGAESPVLAFQCGTAEMNPRSDSAFLKKQYKDNPEKFMAEYGGKFLEASESFVKASTITECVDENRTNVTNLSWEALGHKYFWGLDLGTKHDATALAVSHWEGGNNEIKLVFDYIDRLMVGEGKFVNFRELPLDEILNLLKHVNTILPCYKGATDQYGGSILVQLMSAHDIRGMELVHLTSGINSQMYLTLKTLMENRQVSFPNDPRFIRELRLLEATFTNKYQIKVAAPTEKDAHDDMADAAALSAYMAQTWALNEGRREIQDIMLGIPQNIPPGVVQGSWDPNASIHQLSAFERQLRSQLNPHGAIRNPWRKR